MGSRLAYASNARIVMPGERGLRPDDNVQEMHSIASVPQGEAAVRTLAASLSLFYA